MIFTGEGGRETVVPVRAPEELPCGTGESGTGLAWTANRSGELALTGGGPELEVTEFVSRADCFELVVRHSGIQAKDLDAIALVAGYVELPLLDRTDRGLGTSVMRFDRYHANFNGPRLPAPTGKYSTGGAPGERALVASCADSLAESLPVRHHEPELSLKLCIRGNDKFLLNLQPPLRGSEQGRTAQKALRRAYAKADVAPTDSVLFGCYRGEFATDSQRALDEGLRSARPELTRYWGVATYSVEVPEGSVPVLIGSQEWYDVLGRSTYLCNNIDFDGFFRKRPYQKYLQTFHGYPFKSMGRVFWAGKGYSEERIARECERRNARVRRHPGAERGGARTSTARSTTTRGDGPGHRLPAQRLRGQRRPRPGPRRGAPPARRRRGQDRGALRADVPRRADHPHVRRQALRRARPRSS